MITSICCRIYYITATIRCQVVDIRKEVIFLTNAEIRAKMAYNGIKQYMVAESLGITETSMSRKLRKELPETEKNRILSVIEELTAKTTPITA